MQFAPRSRPNSGEAKPGPSIARTYHITSGRHTTNTPHTVPISRFFVSSKVESSKNDTMQQNSNKDAKKPSRTLSLASFFRRKPRDRRSSALPNVGNLTKSTTLMEPTKEEGVDGNAMEHVQVAAQDAASSENKSADIHVPGTAVELVSEKDSADKFETSKDSADKADTSPGEVEVPSHDTAAAAEITATSTTGESKIQGEDENESKDISNSSEVKALEVPTTITTPELSVAVPVTHSEPEREPRVEVIPDSAIELPATDVSAGSGSEAAPTLAEPEPVTKKAVISPESPVVIPAVVEETSKPSRRSSIFGRFGSLRSKPSSKKNPLSFLPSTSENDTSTNSPTNTPNKVLEVEKKPTEVRPAQQLQRAKTAPDHNVALQKKVQAVLTQPPQLPPANGKSEKGVSTKAEVTGSGFGQDVYF